MVAAVLVAPQVAWGTSPHDEPLVLEPAAPGVWRGDAKGMIVEFRGAPGSDALSIRFVGQSGDPVSPPPAREVTLTPPRGAAVSFSPSATGWLSKQAALPLEDGSRLSIIEADHRHDFRLNVHAKPPASQPDGRTP